MGMSGTLLDLDDELSGIGIISQTLDKEMDMIRHEAVDQNCKPFLFGNTQKL